MAEKAEDQHEAADATLEVEDQHEAADATLEVEDQHEAADASLKGIAAVEVDGKGLKIGICRARWNKPVIDALFDGAKEAILKSGVLEADIHVIDVPGSFELPLAAKKLIKACDAVICLGCLIKGETMHFEYICGPVSQACMTLGQEESKPCIFGVLCCLTEEQALARAGLTPDGHNHGTDWGSAAVQMAVMMRDPIPGMTRREENRRPNQRRRRNRTNNKNQGSDEKPQASSVGDAGRTGNGNNNRRNRRNNGRDGQKKDKDDSATAATPSPAPAAEAAVTAEYR